MCEKITIFTHLHIRAIYNIFPSCILYRRIFLHLYLCIILTVIKMQFNYEMSIKIHLVKIFLSIVIQSSSLGDNNITNKKRYSSAVYLFDFISMIIAVIFDHFEFIDQLRHAVSSHIIFFIINIIFICFTHFNKRHSIANHVITFQSMILFLCCS